MELKVDKRAANYRLVFFQPEPESGERLCIGILFSEDGDRRFLAYDSQFERVRCFAPEFEIGLLQFLMRNLEELVRDRDLHMEKILFSLGSQLALSDERRIISPVPDSAKLHLLDRFVTHGRPSEVMPTAAESHKQTVESRLLEHLFKFASPLVEKSHIRLVQGAGSEAVIGRKVPGIDKVGLLIASEGKATIVDGVDLSIQSPRDVVRRTGRVAHTFWQYRHYANESVFGQELKRVALIFNGAARPGAKYRDAQGFARDILQKESELVIEHDTRDDLQRLENLVLA